MIAGSLFLTILVAVVLAEIISTLLTAAYVTVSAKRKFKKQQAYFKSLEARLREAENESEEQADAGSSAE